MRSRITIIAMLVLGFAFSGTGAGLAVTGSGGDQSTASEAQYTPPGGNQGTVGGEEEAEEEGGEVAGETGNQAAPTTGTAPESGGDVQEVRQVGVESGDGQLPFTGLAAIPILLVGLALTAAGVAMRRGSRSGS